MPRRTNPFQRLTTSIMAAFHGLNYHVEESVLVINNKTGSIRELDILITDKNNSDNKILIECRDHKRKQDVTWIDELSGKSKRLGIKKTIAVSSSGFYKPTIKEAKERGIGTIHLKEAEERDWKQWFLALDIFGIVIDFEPIVKKVNLVSPKGIKTPSLEGIPNQNIFLLNIEKKQTIALSDYINGFVKDPKIIEYVRSHNVNNAINRYDYRIPCDKGVGYCILSGNTYGDFIPLTEVVFSIESTCRKYDVPLKHLKVENKKVHVGDAKILGNDTRIVIEERDKLLKIMLERKIKKNSNNKPQ